MRFYIHEEGWNHRNELLSSNMTSLGFSDHPLMKSGQLRKLSYFGSAKFQVLSKNFQFFSPQIRAPSETVGVPFNWLGWGDHFSVLKSERFNVLQMHVFHIVQQNLSLITKASHTKTHWKGSSHRGEKVVMFLNYDVIIQIMTQL